MAGHTLSLLAAASVLAVRVAAQSTVIPLVDRIYSYPSQIPYKVDTNDSGRGPQFGYTLCNSTTQNQESDCQLAMMNHIDDFCLWGPPLANSTIADTEAETVAWCTKTGWGTRIIPAGTLTGVQVLKAPSYILFSGTINQQGIDIQADDDGGELDPHGADLRGNPLGGLVYSNGFPSNNGNNGSFQQVIEWHNFMGSDVFCFKICDPSVSDSTVYCNNIFDETGCSFVSPAAYEEGVFEVCDSDNMDPVGVYTGSDGKTSTYSQPAVVTSLPSVRTPSSSNCVTYTSSLLYADGGSVNTTSGGTTATGSTTGSTTATATGSTTKATGSTTKATTVSSSSSTAKTTSSGAAMRLSPISENPVGFAPILAIGVSIIAGMGAIVAGL
jgi:hypothetical protein